MALKPSYVIADMEYLPGKTSRYMFNTLDSRVLDKKVVVITTVTSVQKGWKTSKNFCYKFRYVETPMGLFRVFPDNSAMPANN